MIFDYEARYPMCQFMWDGIINSINCLQLLLRMNQQQHNTAPRGAVVDEVQKSLESGHITLASLRQSVRPRPSIHLQPPPPPPPPPSSISCPSKLVFLAAAAAASVLPPPSKLSPINLTAAEGYTEVDSDSDTVQS